MKGLNWLSRVFFIFGFVFGFLHAANAQSITVPAAQPTVEACFSIANQAAAARVDQWSQVQPCLDALKLDLSERQRVSTLTNLALVQSYFGDFDSAHENFDQALSLSSSYPDVYLNRANLYYLERNFEAAIRDYSEALRLNPSSLDILYLNRGMAYQSLGEYRLAEMDFRAALSVRPNWTLIVDKLESLEIERSSLSLDR